MAPSVAALPSSPPTHHIISMTSHTPLKASLNGNGIGGVNPASTLTHPIPPSPLPQAHLQQQQQQKTPPVPPPTSTSNGSWRPQTEILSPSQRDSAVTTTTTQSTHSDSGSSLDLDSHSVPFAFDSMEDALEAFSRGEFLVVMDDENRENEGDLIISASHCTTEKMAWMIKHTSGYICIALTGERLEELEIPMMVPENQERHRTAYTVTVDYKHGTTTGISAHDRSLTVRSLASPTSTPSDFTRPGHMVPLRARAGGVLTRKGHTESSVDLCLLTNQYPAGVLCELVNDDKEGTMARRDDCRRFADRWGLKMISVEMLVEWRKSHPLP